MNRVYFIDRDLGYRIFPDALEEAGLSVIRHDDVFDDPTTPDTEWLQRVAKEGWVAVSGNKDILPRVRKSSFLADPVKKTTGLLLSLAV